jgi:hypothetical protein
MPAIITDQFRIKSAESFVSGITGIGSTTNNYYLWIGLPNSNEISSRWDDNPPSPKDAFVEENDYWDTMIAMKKINPDDVVRVIRKIEWRSGTFYDYYRHDYSRTNLSNVSSSTNLYDANYYVINSDYRVYICIQNGTDPENPLGRPSLDEPTFTDLEPRSAGTSGDGYIWKYLYTIKPNEIIKFDSTNFMPVPNDWETNSSYQAVRNNADQSGQIKIVTIQNRGVGYGTAATYNNVPINGDGQDATCSVIVNSAGTIDAVEITNGGSNYTFGTVDLDSSGIVNDGSTSANLEVIIPPSVGHGYDIYKELGAYRVLIYSRLENDSLNPDFITGNEFSRVGIVKNPVAFDSTEVLTLSKASNVYALKLTGTTTTRAIFNPDRYIRQTIGTGITAVGRVISWTPTNGVLKYWQDKTLASGNTATYGFKLNRFTSSPETGGNTTILGGNVNLSIDTNFGTTSEPGIKTTINNRTYYLGQSFVNGIANPEVKKYSGEVIYVDNRAAITRSSTQKEDIKIVLEF